MCSTSLYLSGVYRDETHFMAQLTRLSCLKVATSEVARARAHMRSNPKKCCNTSLFCAHASGVFSGTETKCTCRNRVASSSCSTSLNALVTFSTHPFVIRYQHRSNAYDCNAFLWIIPHKVHILVFSLMTK